MAGLSDQDRAWFHSRFSALAILKNADEWQNLVTSLMQARHPGQFVQVDPAGRGDKGCDGWVDGLMLACYGATSPNQYDVTEKVRTDFNKAVAYWSVHMTRWAFVHNNASGLPYMAAEAVMALRAEQDEDSDMSIEVWPPQVLWDYCTPDLTREQLAIIIGAPPSDHPAGITYIGQCVQALARTRLSQDIDQVLPVPQGKIESNHFSDEVAELIKSFQMQTDHVRYYFLKSSPGEQQQAIENLRMRYDGLRARLDSADAIFHALCDDLVEEAFRMTSLDDDEQKRSAAGMVVTHFFETCQIFEPPREL